MYTIKKLLSILFQSTKLFINEGYTYRASGLAFTTLLALVPLLSVTVFILSFFPFFKEYVAVAQDYLFTHFLPGANKLIQVNLETFIAKTQQLPIVGFIFLFFTTSALLITMVHSLNDIWQARRSYKNISQWIIYWSFLLLTPVFIGLSVSLSTYIFSLSWFTDKTSIFHYGLHFLDIFPFLLNTIILTLIYVIIPNRRVYWSEGLVGGLVAAILFQIMKQFFTFYIQNFTAYEVIYGVLAAFPIFLLWVYMLWVIFLYGALVTHDLYAERLEQGKP